MSTGTDGPQQPAQPLPPPAPAGTKAAVDARLLQVKATLPEVASAYVPSGILPPAAVPWLLVGGVAGVPVGAIVGAIAAGIWSLLMMASGAMAGGCLEAGWIVYIFWIWLALIGFVGYFAIYALLAVGVAYAVCGVGKLGKNRSIIMPKVVSIGSAVCAAAVMHWTMNATWWPFIANVPLLQGLSEAARNAAWLNWTLGGAGAIAAAIVGPLIAAERVKSMKFSETHDQYMKTHRLPTVTPDQAREIITAMNAGNLDAACNTLRGAPAELKKGERVEVELFATRGGEEGFLEIEYYFHEEYIEDGSKQEHEENWLAGSWHLDAPQIAALMACSRKG